MVKISELQAQINALLAQLQSLGGELENVHQDILGNENYERLVNQAEGAFLKNEYLEAFLIQSCIIEGVLRNCAFKKLSPIIAQTPSFKAKLENYEIARIADVLFIAGKIEKKLYEDLDNYRKKRNSVIHDLLSYNNSDKLNKELKVAYKSGKHMKGFIVDEIKRGPNVQELQAQINVLLAQLQALQEIDAAGDAWAQSQIDEERGK